MPGRELTSALYIALAMSSAWRSLVFEFPLDHVYLATERIESGARTDLHEHGELIVRRSTSYRFFYEIDLVRRELRHGRPPVC